MSRPFDLIVYRKGDIVMEPMNSRDVLPKNVPGVGWGWVGVGGVGGDGWVGHVVVGWGGSCRGGLGLGGVGHVGEGWVGSCRGGVGWGGSCRGGVGWGGSCRGGVSYVGVGGVGHAGVGWVM